MGFPKMVEALPIWMLFGAIGSTLGHELTHAFESAAMKHASAEGAKEHWYITRYEVNFPSQIFLGI